jgi:hypothetical protein
MEPDVAAFCIASACMAWRYEMIVDVSSDPDPSDRGYCGAFGRPA